mmetsp:Transcript_8945/g.12230  ORF Transcript_8945/g.12230 Transcript_8945/m.12230 type:complete len:937 (+) Transcript_8945:199-3009(+)
MSEGNRPRSDSTEVAYRKIFIGGLSYSTDEDKLRKYFKAFGTVQDAVVMKDPVTKRSRGFGFITFSEINAVDIALANEPHTIDTRKVEAKRAVPRSEIAKELSAASNNRQFMTSPSGHSPLVAGYPSNLKSPGMTGYASPPPQIPQNKSSASLASFSSASSGGSYNPIYDSRGASDPRINMEEYAYNKVFVGGLHYDTRDAEFRAYFEKYGKVVSAEVMFNRETHKSRGFGFIVFELEQGAVKVCTEKEHIIDGKLVEVKRAIPRSKILSPSSASPTMKGISPSPTSTGRFPLAASPNVRDNVRRTFSVGSAQNLPLSAQSLSTIAALQQVKTSPQFMSNSPIGNVASNSSNNNTPIGLGSGSKAQQSSSANAKLGIASSSRSGSTTSYAAALKLGSGYQEYEEDIMRSSDSGMNLNNEHNNSLGLGMNLGLNMGMSMNLNSLGLNSNNNNNQNNNNGGNIFDSSNSMMMNMGNMGVGKMPSSIDSNMDTQLAMQFNQQMSGMDLSRPLRSFSEPNIKFEGFETFLNNEQQFDLSMYMQYSARQQAPGSNNSSRSNSFYVPQNAVAPGGAPNYMAMDDGGGSNSLHGQSPSISRFNSQDGMSGKFSSHSGLDATLGIHSAKQSPSLGSISWLSTPPPPVNSLDAASSNFLSLQLPPAVGGNGSVHGSGSGSGSGSKGVSGIAAFDDDADVDALFGTPVAAATLNSTPSSQQQQQLFNSPVDNTTYFNQMDAILGVPELSFSQHRQQQMQQQTASTRIPSIDAWNSMFLTANTPTTNTRSTPQSSTPPHSQQQAFDPLNQMYNTNNDSSQMFQRLTSLGQSPQQPQQHANSQYYFDQDSASQNTQYLHLNQLMPPGGSQDAAYRFPDNNSSNDNININNTTPSSFIASSGGTGLLPGRPAEFTETDELFKFNDLNLDSTDYNNDPSRMQTWMSNSRR